MINVAQVVAAVAAGSLLTVAATLVFKVYGRHRPAQPTHDIRPRADDHDDREWRIEAAAQIAVESFDLLARQSAGSGPRDSAADEQLRTAAETFPLDAELETRCRTAAATRTRHGAVAVRGKRHLTMLTFVSVGLLASAGTVLREAWHTSRNQVVVTLIGATAASTATMMPYLIDGAPPIPIPAASSPWRVPPQPDQEAPEPEPASEPVPLSPTLPEASAPGTATTRPSESATPSAPPEPTVAATPSATAEDDRPADEYTPVPPGDNDPQHGRGTPSPSADDGEPSHSPTESPEAPADRPVEVPAGAERSGGACSFACG
ncbi:hypothetical protein ACIQ9J_15150 [Streptomyces sp. NPDC094153]|uniref:hypothetical protein n=1 Tax=Streptomyces sp. NPDC094153 TaxID=3366058 RepID=UPI00381E8F15